MARRTESLLPGRRALAVSLAATSALLALPGCARFYYGAAASGPVATDLNEATDAATDALMQAAPLPPQSSLVVGTVVNVDALAQSTRLGRLVAEQVGGRLAQRGFTVRELRLRGNVLVREGTGELLLSRELRELGQAHGVQAVVVGTYAVAATAVYVNLRLVRPADAAVLAAQPLVLPMDANIRSLLR